MQLLLEKHGQVDNTNLLDQHASVLYLLKVKRLYVVFVTTTACLYGQCAKGDEAEAVDDFADLSRQALELSGQHAFGLQQT